MKWPSLYSYKLPFLSPCLSTYKLPVANCNCYYHTTLYSAPSQKASTASPLCGECMCLVTHRDSRWAGIPIASLPVLHDANVNRTWCVNSFQMQLRDYPQPLLAMTEVTISGKMLFAEQEAQERGSWDHQPHIEFTQLSYQQRGFLSCSVVLHHGSHLIWWRPRAVLFEQWLCNKLMLSWWPISLVNNMVS